MNFLSPKNLTNIGIINIGSSLDAIDNDIKKLDKNIFFSKRYKSEKTKNKIVVWLDD